MAYAHHGYTVACICPMGIELAPVIAMLDEEHTPLATSRDQNSYTLGKMAGHCTVIAVLPEIGTNAASVAATQLMNDFPAVRFGLLVGIGGGVPDDEDEHEGGKHDIRLGDVVVSKPEGTIGGVVQYDMGKRTSDNHFEHSGSLNKPPAILRSSMEKLAAEHRMKGNRIAKTLQDMFQTFPLMVDEYSYPGHEYDQLFKASYKHQQGRTCYRCNILQRVPRRARRDQHPKIHYGNIASANVVVKDAQLRDQLHRQWQVLCVEMEAAGLMSDFPCLVIRGICDYADSHKNKRWQPYAAATAAAYVKELLSVISPPLVGRESSIQQVCTADHKIHQLLDRVIGVQKRMLSETQEQSRLLDTRNSSKQDERVHQIFNTSNYEQHKDRNPYRAEGTCRWIFEHPLFSLWYNEDHSGLLWISADPGCGKSVFARSLVDDNIALNQASKSNLGTTTCYFFFKDNRQQNGIATALCAVLHQLFTQQPQLIRHAVPHMNRSSVTGLPEAHLLWEILQVALADSSAQPIICVFDALDECIGAERQQLIAWLCEHHRKASLEKPKSSNFFRSKFLVTSRPYDSVQRWFGGLLKKMPEIRVRGEEENDQIQQEINIVVDQQVDELADDFDIPAKSKQRLRNSLHNMQHRTYLWLYLSTEAIRDAFHDSVDPELVKVDQILPRNVEDAYEKMLQNVKPTLKSTVKHILTIIVGARRTLTIDEMAEALEIALRLEGREKSKVRKNHLEKCIRDWCRLFIYINHSKLYLIHQTAKEFLLAPESIQTGDEPDLYGWRRCLTNNIVEQQMAKICIEYLYQNLNHCTSPQSGAFFEYSARHWGEHLRDEYIEDERLLHRVLCLYDTKGPGFQKWFSVIRHKFAEFSSLVPMTPEILSQHLAALYGHVNVLTVIQQRAEFNIEGKDAFSGGTALIWAAEYGQHKVLQKLIASGANINAQDRREEHALYRAARRGDECMVQKLIASGSNVNAPAWMGETALSEASHEGHDQIVKILLANGADVHAITGFWRTALQAAVVGNHVKIAQMLIANGADVNADHKVGCPLHTASQQGYEEMVRLLVANGARMSICGAKRKAAFCTWHSKGDIKVLHSFLLTMVLSLMLTQALAVIRIVLTKPETLR